MRPLLILPLALATFLTFSGCKKDATRTSSCEQIKTGILTNDINLVKQEFEKLLTPFTPAPTAQDTYGHKANIEKLVAQLNGGCGITARAACYNCIKTLPPQTELYLTVTDGDNTVNKVIDLSYDNSKRLIFSNMHD